jgi:hypothetical protein
MAYKRITNFLIVSVVTIVLIISTTINSDFALAAPAIKHEGEGVLHIENKVEATCPREELHFNPQKECPQGSNTGMHAIIRFGGENYYLSSRCLGRAHDGKLQDPVLISSKT